MPFSEVQRTDTDHDAPTFMLHNWDGVLRVKKILTFISPIHILEYYGQIVVFLFYHTERLVITRTL